MISDNAKQYCKDDISKIENYELAIADDTQVWDCHHRLALTLDGEVAHDKEDLKRLGMYYHRPYFELIFLTRSEHSDLHNSTEEFKQKMSESKKGTKLSQETKKHMSESKMGHIVSKETREKIGEAQKGNKNHNYGKHTWNYNKPISVFGEKFFEHYKIITSKNKVLYNKERKFFNENGHCSWE